MRLRLLLFVRNERSQYFDPRSSFAIQLFSHDLSYMELFVVDHIDVLIILAPRPKQHGRYQRPRT